ncbi:hypothetical protein [Peribacillus phoenicis]|uniref:hypothetical protein n=1 Tax=Peribacillus sp. 1P06PA-2 TaxID=3132295 RepID=UPI0039A5E4C7
MKKLATLLPNNWLAKTPQPLAVRRLGRQSAEREWISEINSNGFFKKTCRQTALIQICLLGVLLICCNRTNVLQPLQK